MSPALLGGMDFILAQARLRGLRIIWALADNWYPVGGLDNYVKWSTTARSHNDVFTDAQAGSRGSMLKCTSFQTRVKHAR